MELLEEMSSGSPLPSTYCYNLAMEACTKQQVPHITTTLLERQMNNSHTPTQRTARRHLLITILSRTERNMRPVYQRPHPSLCVGAHRMLARCWSFVGRCSGEGWPWT